MKKNNINFKSSEKPKTSRKTTDQILENKAHEGKNNVGFDPCGNARVVESICYEQEAPKCYFCAHGISSNQVLQILSKTRNEIRKLKEENSEAQE